MIYLLSIYRVLFVVFYILFSVDFFFYLLLIFCFFFFFQAEDGIRDRNVTGVQTCALPILGRGFIDNAAHLGGMVSGALLALVVEYRRPGERSGVTITWTALQSAALVLVADRKSVV